MKRIVIVGASLAGLRAAEAVRRAGHQGPLTIIGDEPHPPYDRPPLSKYALAGRVPVEHVGLARVYPVDADWRLGVRAVGLDRTKGQVELASGESIPFDTLLIASGARARPWPDEAQAGLSGVSVLRGWDDAVRLRQALSVRPGRVLIVGGGLIGSEAASACRDLELPVTVVERNRGPMAGTLGRAISSVAEALQRGHGVDVRCRVTVTALAGNGRVREAVLSDGTTVAADVVIVALGIIRNIEWLRDSGLSVDGRGVVCDRYCRVLDAQGTAVENVFAAGDVARWLHPLYGDELLAVEHWGHAVAQAQTAAHNMVSVPLQPYTHLPAFWSHQFGVSIKAVGVPAFGDEVVVAQGSTHDYRFIALYGSQGRVVAAVSFNQSRWLEYYRTMVLNRSELPVDNRFPAQFSKRRQRVLR